MGSFNIQCGVSGLNCQWNEDIYVIFLRKNGGYDGTLYYPKDAWTPISLAQKTKYNDYGSYKPFELNEWNKILLSGIDLNDEDDPPKFMAIHAGIYEHFTKRPFHKNEGLYNESVGIAKNKHKQFAKFLKKIKKAYEEDAFQGYMTMRGSIGIDWRDDVITNLGMAFMEEPKRSLINDDLAVELYKKWCFEYNFGALNRYFIPSGYASQVDPIQANKELVKSMKDVLKAKEAA